MLNAKDKPEQERIYVRIYRSDRIDSGRSYQKRVLAPVCCVWGIWMLVAAGMGFCFALTDWKTNVPAQWLSVLALFAVVIAGAAALNRAGQNARRDALFFVVDDSENLYVVDARSCAGEHGGRRSSPIAFLIRFFGLTFQTGKVIDCFLEDNVLETLMRSGDIPAYAVRITRVRQLLDVSAGKFAVCNIRAKAQAGTCCRYDLSNHPEELLAWLEQHSAAGKWEHGAKKYTLLIFLSAALLTACLGVCVCSHPRVGALNGKMYFPSLFALQILFIVLGVFIVKRRKGE